jgi:predicted alpha/beta superfamily hydrolase
LIFFPTSVQAQQSNILTGKEYRIRSRIPGEERRYVADLPASYETDDFYIQMKHPVLILLDGDTYFHSASGIVRYMGG